MGKKPKRASAIESFNGACDGVLRKGQPRTIADLHALLGVFAEVYNHHRSHGSLAHRATPAAIYTSRPKATPAANREHDTHDRVRNDVIDGSGTVSLRVSGRLHHIGVGRALAGTRVLILAQDLHVRILNAATGELLRELLIDPARDYQPTGKPRRRPKRNNPEPL